MEAYLRELSNTPLLTAEEEHELAVKVEAGDEDAREKMIVSNLRLVVSIAKKYRGSELELSDLVAEGNAGLIKAVDRFDPSRGTRFSSYATWWIRQAISRSLGETRTIPLPVSVTQDIRRYRRIKTLLSRELGFEPSVAVIAQRMEITEEKLEYLIRLGQPGVRLDMNLDDTGQEQLGGIFAEAIDTGGVESLYADLETEDAMKVFDRLRENERTTLILRFGFRDRIAWTQVAVAQFLGLTRQRVQQIEVVALAKVAKLKARV